MNKALKNILERNSHRNLIDPIPSKDEMEQVYQAALRAPDHAWVRPSNFIQVSGEGLKKLSDIFVEVAEESFENLTVEILEKYKNAPFRAPLIVILVSTQKEHPKVPRIEQIISTGTAGQNIIKDTKNYQEKEWSEEKTKINKAKDKIIKAKEKVLN